MQATSSMKAADLFDLTGEVAMVTGASSGLGRRFARVLAANGAKVVVTARRKERLETLVAEIAREGGAALAVEADATSDAAMARAFDAAEAAFGTVSILVANAGHARSGRLLDQPDEDWTSTIDLDLNAVRRCGVLAARRMRDAGRGGAIVNIASILSFGVGRGNGAYSAAKAGVAALTSAMGFEFARYGIRANAIAPGYFATEMNEEWLKGGGAAMADHIPMRRFGQEGELDGVLLLLAAPRAGAYINGAIYLVDGGHTPVIAGV
jgi:3-oxoacyl-[acyl-carrier protein] reductase